MTNYDIQFWYELMYEIFIYFVNVVYFNKCAHTIKSLNLTDSVRNVWQENIDCPFPFIISNVHVKRCMNFRYNSYIPHVRVSTFFYLMNWKGFLQLMRNLWQVEQVVACLNLALPDHSASIYFLVTIWYGIVGFCVVQYTCSM